MEEIKVKLFLDKNGNWYEKIVPMWELTKEG